MPFSWDTSTSLLWPLFPFTRTLNQTPLFCSCLAIPASATSPALEAFATSHDLNTTVPLEILDSVQANSIARLPEYVYATCYTSCYKEAPYTTITNSIVFMATQGFQFNLKGLFTDVYGGSWYKITPTSGQFIGVICYISCNDSITVVG